MVTFVKENSLHIQVDKSNVICRICAIFTENSFLPLLIEGSDCPCP